MSSLQECRDLASKVDQSSRSHGCLNYGEEEDHSTSPEEYLRKRPRWIPSFNLLNETGYSCKSNSLPFCSSMNVETANRYSSQYIALHNFSKYSNSGSIHHSLSTCAVLVIGAGGLGSPVLMYLAASGLGLIGIIDGDVVEVSNLHRQIIHDEANLAMNKAKSAKERLLKINSKGRYIAYEYYFGVKEANELVPLYDLIVDASDNPQTKYLINDSCIYYNKPYVIASCIKAQGQLMVFNRLRNLDGDQRVPCFRCICPSEGNPSLSFAKNACSAAGVLGSIPGILGTIQATEVLKLCSGTFESSLSPGRMLVYEAVNPINPFRTVELSWNRNCEVCGENAGPISLKMYEAPELRLNLERDHLAISQEEFWKLYMDKVKKGLPVYQKLKVTENEFVQDEQGDSFLVYLIDVRPSPHFFICHLPGAVSWPLQDIQNSALTPDSFNHRVETVTNLRANPNGSERILFLTICRMGNSSRSAANAIRNFLSSNPLPRDILCYSVAGGMHYLNTHLKMKIPIT